MGLFGNNSDHPLADVKSARQLLQGVPRNDPLKALQEITDWIESVREQADFCVDQQFEVLNLLDEAARPYMRKLVHDYFTGHVLSNSQENRTWMALNEFFAQTEQSYHKLLTAYRNGAKGSSAIKPVLPLIAARGIYAASSSLKFTAAHYKQVDPAIWLHLAEYYSHAEDWSYLDKPVVLYTGLSLDTSVRCKFASTLMWYTLGAGGLSPPHIHLTERMTAHFCRYFTVDEQPAAGSLFYFDLAHPALPIRVAAEITPHPGMRFLGAGEVKPHIEALLRSLEKNIVPEDINLGSAYAADMLRDVVRHLVNYWNEPLPVRRNVRHQVKKVTMKVVHGFANISGQAIVACDAEDDMIWEVEDISASGFRCVLPANNAGGVKIGSLLGTMLENVAYHGAGIVRRLSRDGQNNLHVGVEMLSNQVEKVVLHAQAGSIAGGGQTALWLRKPDDDTGEVCLLMNPDAFLTNLSLHVQFEGNGYRLILLMLLERGVDYDLARYRKVAEDTSADEAYQFS